MIYLGKIKACSNPDCRLVLPADQDAPWNAGFWVSSRKNGQTYFQNFCKDCTRKVRGRGKRRQAETRLVEFEGRLVPRRRCLECEREGYCLDDSRSSFAIKSRSPMRWGNRCKRCVNAKQRATRPDTGDEGRAERNARRREQYRERVESDPEFVAHKREYGQRYYHEHPERMESRRTAQKRYRKKNKTAIRELRRMEYRLKAEREGRSVRQTQTVVDVTAPRVPLGPFRRWLEVYGERSGDAENIEALARDLGLIPRRVWGVLNEEYTQVAMDCVSRALTNSKFIVNVDGRPIATIDDLYPEGLPRG